MDERLLEALDNAVKVFHRADLPFLAGQFWQAREASVEVVTDRIRTVRHLLRLVPAAPKRQPKLESALQRLESALPKRMLL